MIRFRGIRAHDVPYGTGRRALSYLMAGVVLALVMGFAVATADDGAAADTPAAGRYGKTPDTAIPFRNFQEPYLRFFQEPVPYYGTGRESGDRDAEAVRIGFIGPVPPANDSDLGQMMLDGATLAIEQANEAGGCRGREIELVTREDLGLWGATSNEMVAFKYEDDVLAVLGSIDGANTHIALRVALKIGMPMVNTGTTDPTLTETNIPWLLRCMADDRQQGYALAHHVYLELGLTRVAAFRVNDRYGRTGIIEFRDAAVRLGHPLLGELRWDLGDRSFDRQLDRIEELSPEAIVIWGNAGDSAAAVKEIRARGMSQRIFGPDRLASRAFVEGAGDDAEGIVAASSYDPTMGDPVYEQFTADFRERFGYEAETFAAHAYDGMNILIDAIREAGLNRTLIRDALYAMTDYSGVTGEIEFDTTLNDVGPVYLATIESGKISYREVDFSVGANAAPYHQLDGESLGGAIPESPPIVPDSAFRVGAFLPLDEEGQVVVAGMKSALEEYNRASPKAPRVELIVADTRGQWGIAASELVEMASSSSTLAIIGSTERKGSHLAETMAAKLHLPVLPLCGTDATLTAIPLPWVFNPARTGTDGQPAELAHDAMALVLARVASGAHTRSELRESISTGDWFTGHTGSFRFDSLGNRVDQIGTRSEEHTATHDAGPPPTVQTLRTTVPTEPGAGGRKP
jgi:ABC-type branched-subunit amino acid transport system substrate-binding protein